MSWWDFITNGLCRGAIYALVALGYTMIYGILGMINYAHGEVFMIGMFACVYAIGLLTAFFEPLIGWNLLIALLASMAFAGGLGYMNERIAYRRLRGASRLAPLTTAIGISIVLQNFIMLSVSKDQIRFPKFDIDFLTQTRVGFAPYTLSLIQLTILIASIGLMAGLFYLIHRTRFGIAMRATAQDPLMARLVGIQVDRIISMTFILASAMAAAAGVMVASYNGVMRFDTGASIGLKAFTAAVLGGIGNIPGAVLGGLLIGLAEDATSVFLGSDWKNISTFVILMLVLILRPRGLLGERVAEKV